MCLIVAQFDCANSVGSVWYVYGALYRLLNGDLHSLCALLFVLLFWADTLLGVLG